MRALIALCAFLCLALPAPAQDIGPGLIRADAPEWVDDLPLPAVDEALQDLSLDGVHYILSDHQRHWQGETALSYARTALLVTDRAGLERAATISFDYDPRFDRLTLIRLVVIRDGQEIDLRDSIREEVLRREQRLEQGIIDGTLTAWLQVPDLRVGDIVDYASLREMKPMVAEGERAVWSILEWGVPVQLSRTVVLWPEDWGFNQAPLPERVSHVSSPVPGGLVRHEWQRVNHVPERWEDNTPAGHEQGAILRLSALPDWGGISAAVTPYYAADYPLTPEWDARVAAIAATSNDPETRAMAALRLVQDELRYVSLSVGAGGYWARLPQEVIASGFGDCKDKALLLAVILKRLGIEAAVALTDVDAGPALPEEVPMLGAFDHAIVRIRHDGASHWVDPTASHQGGGFFTAAPPPFAWALPLTGPDQRGLEPIPVTPEQGWSTDVTESYLFNTLGVGLEVRSVYRGGAADSMRQKWATNPASVLSRDYLDYYAGRYPGLVMVREMEVTDDRARNRLEMVERYLLPLTALRGSAVEGEFTFGTEDFASNLPERLKGPRRAPLDAGSPAIFRHHVRVRNAPMEFIAPDPLHIRNAGFRFSLTGSDSPAGTLSLDWEYERSGAPVRPEMAGAVIADGRHVHDNTWFTWDVSPDPGFGP